MNDPFVSIIIPAKDAEKTIERCVFSVLGLDYTQYEVIVVDDGSRDKTGKMLQGFSQRIKIISFPQNRGPSKARNDAAIQARGEFIAFTDADCVVDKSWLRALLAGFSGPDIVSVGGRQEVPVDESAFGRNVAQGLKRMGLITDYLRNSDRVISVKHNPSCNVMYRKDIFLKEGGFLEGLWPAEDVELDYRLLRKHYILSFNPKAVVYHYRPDTCAGFLSLMFRYGFGQGLLVKKYSFFKAIQYIPFASMLLVLFFFIILFMNIKLGLAAVLLFSLLSVSYFSFNPAVLFLSMRGILLWHLGFIKGILSGEKP